MTTRWSEIAGKRVRRWRALARVAMVGAFFSGCAGSLVQAPVKFSNVTPGAPQEIVGTLVRPAGAGPFPAVIQFHGCGGLEPQSYRWARWLADHGYIALVLDSFGPRKVKGDCRTGPDEPPATARFDDAIGGLRYLPSQPDRPPPRITALRWSPGGGYAVAGRAW